MPPIIRDKEEDIEGEKKKEEEEEEKREDLIEL